MNIKAIIGRLNPFFSGLTVFFSGLIVFWMFFLLPGIRLGMGLPLFATCLPTSTALHASLLILFFLISFLNRRVSLLICGLIIFNTLVTATIGEIILSLLFSLALYTVASIYFTFRKGSFGPYTKSQKVVIFLGSASVFYSATVAALVCGRIFIV